MAARSEASVRVMDPQASAESSHPLLEKTKTTTGNKVFFLQNINQIGPEGSLLSCIPDCILSCLDEGETLLVTFLQKTTLVYNAHQFSIAVQVVFKWYGSVRSAHNINWSPYAAFPPNQQTQIHLERWQRARQFVCEVAA